MSVENFKEVEEENDLQYELNSDEEDSDVGGKFGAVGLDSDEEEGEEEDGSEGSGGIKDMNAWGNKKEEFYSKAIVDKEEELEEEKEAQRMVKS